MSIVRFNFMILLNCFILLVSAVSAGNNDYAVQEVRVFESSTKTLAQTKALISADEVYLKTALLERAFGLVRKKLSEDMVGICLEELCIPYSKSKGSHRLRYEGDTEYVPVKHLVSALEGTSIWESNSADLLLNLKRQAASELGVSAAESEFTLNDMDGNPVALSDFKGKKVALFAWASW